MQKHPVVLASQSKYRKELLDRLNIPFVQAKPLIDEEKFKNDALEPKAMALHLARLKAQSLKAQFPDAIIIGSDQLVSHQGRILGKPLTKEKALQQLLLLAGHTHELLTAVTLVTPEKEIHHMDITRLTMKPLKATQIERYLQKDQPFDCAGSYKIELSGISLFEKIEAEDSTAIQGLPLIWLSNTMNALGWETP